MLKFTLDGKNWQDCPDGISVSLEIEQEDQTEQLDFHFNEEELTSKLSLGIMIPIAEQSKTYEEIARQIVAEQ
jgi:hypothetical protein